MTAEPTPEEHLAAVAEAREELAAMYEPTIPPPAAATELEQASTSTAVDVAHVPRFLTAAEQAAGLANIERLRLALVEQRARRDG